MRLGARGEAVLLAGVACLALAAFAPRAAAEPCLPLPEVGSERPGLRAGLARSRFLRTTVAEERWKAAAWNWGWGLLFAGAVGAATQGLVTADDSGVRAEQSVRIFKSSVGVVTRFIFPMRLPDVPDEDGDCAAVRRAEQALLDVARAEARRRGWLPRLVGAGFNIATGLYLGLVHDRWRVAILDTLVGYAVVELQIWSAPSGGKTALERYRRGQFGVPVEFFVSPIVGDATGAAIGIRF